MNLKESGVIRGGAAEPLGRRVGAYVAWLARQCKGCLRKGGNCKSCCVEPALALDAEIRAAGGSVEASAPAPEAALPSDPDELIALARKLRAERRKAARVNPRMAAIARARAEILGRLRAAGRPMRRDELLTAHVNALQTRSILKSLVRGGQAVLSGVKRGARYSVRPEALP